MRQIPTIRCGHLLVHWNRQFKGWEFTADGLQLSLSENPAFDPAIFSMIDTVKQWLVELDESIDREIQKHLDGWCEWDGHKQLVGIDVSWLVDRSEIDVSYVGESWGDLGVNIVIVGGCIKDSYAGD